MPPVRNPDSFSPVNPGCLRLPKQIKVKFIGSEADIYKLEKLIGSKYIGMDTEWHP